MIIDARENVVNSIVEDVRVLTSSNPEFPHWKIDNLLERTAKEAGFIWDTLVEKGIEFKIVEKQGWGKVFKFEYKGRELFTHNYLMKSDKLELYFWSEEYSCKPCGYKLSRVNRDDVVKFLDNDRIPKGYLVGDDIVRDLADIFKCSLEAMYAIIASLGYKVSVSTTDYMRYL